MHQSRVLRQLHNDLSQPLKFLRRPTCHIGVPVV